MMTNEQAAAYTVDRNARLHRPDGTFASRAEVEQVERCAYALHIECADMMATMMAKAQAKAARRFFAPETQPAKGERLYWEGQKALLTSAHLWGHI
jgi:hypothetical protein